MTENEIFLVYGFIIIFVIMNWVHTWRIDKLEDEIKYLKKELKK